MWQFETWRNSTVITSWNPPHVEHVRGTDALQFRPGLQPNSTVEVGRQCYFHLALFNTTTMMSLHVPWSHLMSWPPCMQVWAGELFRAMNLVVHNKTMLAEVEVLRFVPDPKEKERDPRYYQVLI